MKQIVLFCFMLLLVLSVNAQISKVETYQIGTQIDYYIGQCGNDIPEAQGKFSFCDRAGNLAVVEESLGLNERGTLRMVPNYYDDREIYVTRNGISMRLPDASWENVPNVSIANPELMSWNNTGQIAEGVALPDGRILITDQQSTRYLHIYNMETKEMEALQVPGNLSLRKVIYNPDVQRTFLLLSTQNNVEIWEFENNTFVARNTGPDADEIFNITVNSSTSATGNGFLYVGNQLGLFTVDLTTFAVTKIDNTDTQLLPFDKVNGIALDNTGNLWLAQESTNNGGITKYDPSTQTYDLYELENPGGSVVDLQFQALTIGDDGIIHATARNYFGLVTLDAATPEGVWTTTESAALTTLGVPITYNPNEVYNIDGAIYYITNDFSSGNTANYEVVIREGNTWTGRNDDAPDNISFWMIERFREAHPTPDGGTIWSNSLDDIIVTIDSDDRFTPDIKFNPSGAQSAVDADSKLVQNIFVPEESTEVRKVIAPTTYAYPTENNGGTRAVAQYNDQIWVFNQSAGTIEIYIQDNLVQSYILDPTINLSSYFRGAVDRDGIFWVVKQNFPSANLLRFDRTTETLTEIELSSEFGTVRGIEVAPDGGIWLLSSTDAIFYKNEIEYAFPNDLFDVATIQDGQVDVNGKMHIVTIGGTNGDIHIVENPTEADPIIESINLVNNANESLLPTENTSTTDDIIIDTDGDYWINSSRGFYKIIDDDPAPSYRTNGITTGIISGRLYGDVNDNDQYDEGEEIAGVSVSLIVNGDVQNTVTDGNGIYRIFAKAENVAHTIVVNTLDDDYYLLDRTQQVSVTTLDQNYENNDFQIEVKDYSSIYYKQGQRIGVWGFDRAAFENTFTLAITNMSTTKTFNELATTFLFENKDGGELPEILDVTFTKIDPNGLAQLHSKIAINPKNGRWSLPGISPSTYVQTEDNSIAYTLTEETGKRRVLFTIPEITPRDTWVVEIKTDIFDPTQNGTVIVHTVASTSSPDYEGAPPGGDVFILYPEEDRDFDDVPLPSEDPNSPYVDPFDPENNIYTDPKDVYAPSPYESPLYSSYDPNDKMVEGGNTLEINETDIARKWLTYTIRFENTGNFSAKDVYILDELDENIIPNSFTLLESSAAVEIDFLPSGENVSRTLRFSFNDIFLPFDDENNDGWVKFRVRVKEDIAENTIVNNTGAIYFDQNPPIITNTIQNLFKTPEAPVDTEAPDMVCQNVVVFLDENGIATVAPSDVDQDSTDNEGIVNLELDITTFDCSNLGENTVTLTGTDAAGNSASCTAIVTVEDEFPPQTQCAAPLTISLDENGMATITVDQIDNGTTDNCGIESLEIDITSFDCSNLGENTVTLSVTDTAGFTANCTTIVTVIDDTPPVAICQDVTLSLDANGEASLSIDAVNNGSFDNCSSVGLDLSNFSYTCDDIGTNMVTLFVTDAAGNASTCEAIVTVIDEIPPTAVCDTLTIALDENGVATITPFDVDLDDSIDNCSDITRVLSQDTFLCDNLGTNEVTLTTTDASGNSNMCTAIVTVIDTTIPEIDPATVPADQTIFADETTMLYTMEDFTTGLGITDNCEVTITQDPAVGTELATGVYTVTFTVTDASGNTATQSFELLIDKALGLGENSLSNITVYPNPVQHTLTVATQDSITALELYDMLGRKVRSAQNIETLDVTNLPKAMYILNVFTANGTQTFKIIKQ